MRVISGQKRGLRLSPLPGLSTRPTTDRVKVSMFNILQFHIPGARVLDLFAGTGQLGIECLSRGAERAVFCDRNADSIRVTLDVPAEREHQAGINLFGNFFGDYSQALNLMIGYHHTVRM